MKKLLLSLLLIGFSAKAEFVVPPTPNPVNDYAKVLSLADKEMIAKQLVTLKAETGVQLGILIVDTLDGTSIEEASIKVVESWKLGSKSADDGALLFLAIKDRKSRLEIGRGLQGFLTDANANRILIDMKPCLRGGNYLGAFSTAIGTITEDVKANKADIMRKPDAPSTGIPSIFIFVLSVMGILVLSILGGTYYENKKEKERQRLLDQISKNKKGSWDNYLLLRKMHGTGGGIPQRPVVAKKTKKVDDNNGFITGVATGVAVDEISRSSSSDYSSSSSSDYSSSSSDFSGGGGSFDGGGSSGGW